MKTPQIGLISSLLMVQATVAQAQFPSDKFRDVNAAGPYPIYITAQGVLGKGFDDYRFLSRQFNPAAPRKYLWGFEGAVGFFVYEPKLKNFFVEAALRQLYRAQGNGPGQRLSYIHQTVSLRVGGRINFPFYPITLHVLAGPVIHTQQVIRLDRDTLNGIASRRITTVNKLYSRNRLHLPGIDLKIRFNLIDAVSSSGGLGLYVEGYWAYLVNPRIPVERLVNGASLQDQPRDRWNRSFSVGALIPLALRVKRLAPEPCDWCKQQKEKARQDRKEARKARRRAKSGS